MKVLIILGSTRPGRVGASVAEWFYEIASKRSDIDFELVDIADYNLPLLDEPAPPQANRYTKEHTKRWSKKIAEADAYVFVSPEYNHSVPGAFKNAVDYLFYEWNHKSIGFVTYGSAGGARAVEHWRGVAGELKLADVRNSVLLQFDRDFDAENNPTPSEKQVIAADEMLDDVISWGRALQSVRELQYA